jgi:O-antigen/teichoic acid export membrane protein
MLKGALWMVSFKVVERGLGLISTLILARLLMPADFGIVAMATSLIALLELFSAFGLDTALLQRKDPRTEHYNAAWSMNVLAGCVVGALMVAIAYPASEFYREPRLSGVVMLLGLCSAIQGLENVGVVDFRRNLEFDREFRYLANKKLIGFAITVPLAFWLRDYHALVYATLATRVLVVLYSYGTHPFRPRFSLAGAPDLMHFSKWLVVQNLLWFLRERAGDFIIGRAASSSALGTFAVANQIASMPSTELVAPINRAILPVYVKLAQDKAGLAKQYLSVMSVIALIAIPAVAGVAAMAPIIVLLVLGPTWREAIPVLEILAFYGITQVLQTNAHSAFLALGRPQVFAKINAIHVTMQISLLLWLTPAYGLQGAAWAFLLSALIALPVNFVFITRYLGIRAWSYIAFTWRPLAAAGLMYYIVRWVAPYASMPIGSSSQAFGPVVASILIGVAVYGCTITLLWLVCGRPAGAETAALDTTRYHAGRLLRRR